MEASIETDLDHLDIYVNRPPSFMINLTFERPVGAYADAKELEYITALHQTTDADDETFVDGSIEGELFFLELYEYSFNLDQRLGLAKHLTLCLIWNFENVPVKCS